MTHAEIWFVCCPFVMLLSFYCWEYGMDLLVPVKEG